ncbi:MAG: hypothetical protein C4B59_02575 [Candidatus Methanogaster sp.]|uniref:Uncharacterized protein n=1 Tax=Candidatus Methanogaster sp. TaxID=3386292 RepID=A0AC61L5X1_9EURY|nr:MAG: hypothetical protein C4B59_02575 [ANME-2 cluster archaeon]
MSEAVMKNDEPAESDGLNRGEYVETFAKIATTCDTPMVIGLYGSWGVGKTSLMKLIEAEIDPGKSTTQTVWFDAWLYQFDEHPVMGLLHKMVVDLEVTEETEVKERIYRIARALGPGILTGMVKATTHIDLSGIAEAFSRYEEEDFRIQEDRVNLRENFQKLIEKVQTAKGGRKRIVFFIDDLDRCMPDHILSVLEALKLYLNLEGCVYFLGLDRHALEDSIRYHYKDFDFDMEATSYLDKIIQLPFEIPPVDPDCIESFIHSFLPNGKEYEKLNDCAEILKIGLGGNPRGIKRFINTLLLNDHLARTRKLSKYDPKILTTLLVIQYRNRDLYDMISEDPSLLVDQNTEEWETRIKGHKYLKEVLELVTLPDNAEGLEPYIYLTDVAGIVTEVLQDERGFYTEEGLDQLLAASGKLSDDEYICDKLPLYKTMRQRTWLVATNRNLFYLLDDEKARRYKSVIKWVQPFSSATPLQVRAYISEKGLHVVDIGKRKGWLYSHNMYPRSEELAKKVEKMIALALASD